MFSLTWYTNIGWVNSLKPKTTFRSTRNIFVKLLQNLKKNYLKEFSTALLMQA